MIKIMRLLTWVWWSITGNRDSRTRTNCLEFIESFWGLKVPRAKVCPDHTPPAEYVTAAFFEEVQDCICWANRSGGKTFNGAMVTWLDSVFKAGCETKILGGSGEQSLRMYEHMKSFITLALPAFTGWGVPPHPHPPYQ